MVTNAAKRTRQLLERLSRVVAAHEWTDDLNPAQRSALDYLNRANRFSRAPSNVADYLCTTRGTASQTLKALERKGFIVPRLSATDRRSISYDVTDNGKTALGDRSPLEASLQSMPESEVAQLSRLLETAAQHLLLQQGFRSFGVCNTCRHHTTKHGRPFCALLEEKLSQIASRQLCHEHSATG